MLKTVKVPQQFEPIFQKAQESVAKFFSEKKEEPTKGTIEIFGERYILVRAASMSVDFFETIAALYEKEGKAEANNIARQLLFDIAHAIGKQDARNFHKKMSLQDPIEKLSAGPIHFAHAGWAFVDIFPESSPSPDENYYLIYDHPYSFESDAWRVAGKKSDFPVCIMNAGYSSGWCEESFGLGLVATEIMCQAKGDPACRFIMAPPSRIEGHICAYLKKEPELAKRISCYEVPGFFKRKEMEEDLRALNEQLKLKVKQLLDAQEELVRKEKLSILGQLSGSVGHELRNPLSAINNAVYFLKTVMPDCRDAVKDYLEIIKNEVDTANRIISDLLDFSRTKLPQAAGITAGELLVRSLEKCCIPEGISVTRDIPDDLPRVFVDLFQMGQIFQNLITNAVQAMPEGGSLRIAARRVSSSEFQVLSSDLKPETSNLTPDGDFIEISVSDTGEGISPENMKKLFQPLFTTKAKGIGLGLVVCKKLVEANRGRIEVESELGKGTTFRVCLPTAVSKGME